MEKPNQKQGPVVKNKPARVEREKLVDSLLKPPQQVSYPRSQNLVSVLSKYQDDALVTKHNFMVMGLEIHGEDDALNADADVQSYYSSLANLLSKFNFSYQICVYPRRQRIEAVIERYRADEQTWNKRRAIAKSFLECYPRFLRLAFQTCVERLPNRLTLAEIEPLLSANCVCVGCGETTNLRFSDFDFILGELPHMVLSFADFSDFVYESLLEGLKNASLDDAWFQHVREHLGNVPDEVIDEFRHDLMRVAGTLAVMQSSIRDEALAEPHQNPDVKEMIDKLLIKSGASLDELEESIPGSKERLITALPAAALSLRKVMQETETAIGNYINTTIAAIDRLLDNLVERGVMLETHSLNREQMIRSILFIVTAPVGIAAAAAASSGNINLSGGAPQKTTLSQNALEATYKMLKERCSIAATGLRSVGMKAEQLSADELLRFLKNIYNKDVVWRVSTEDRLGN